MEWTPLNRRGGFAMRSVPAIFPNVVVERPSPIDGLMAGRGLTPAAIWNRELASRFAGTDASGPSDGPDRQKISASFVDRRSLAAPGV